MSKWAADYVAKRIVESKPTADNIRDNSRFYDGDKFHKRTDSMLQIHPKAIVVCDEPACDKLTVVTSNTT